MTLQQAAGSFIRKNQLYPLVSVLNTIGSWKRCQEFFNFPAGWLFHWTGL